MPSYTATTMHTYLHRMHKRQNVLCPVLGPSADEAADRLDALHRRLVDRHEALMLQRWIEHFVAVSGPELDAATAFRAGELHMAARLDPARTADWRRSWRRARRRRPERW